MDGSPETEILYQEILSAPILRDARRDLASFAYMISAVTATVRRSLLKKEE